MRLIFSRGTMYTFDVFDTEKPVLIHPLQGKTVKKSFSAFEYLSYVKSAAVLM